MYYRIGARFSYCIAGGRLILLDLLHDRYCAVSPKAEASLKTLIDRMGIWPSDEATLTALLKSGILELMAGPLDLPPGPDIVLPTVDHSAAGARPHLGDVTVAIVTQLAVTVRLRWSRVALVAGRLRRRMGKDCRLVAGSESRIGDLVAAFDRADAILGRTDRCLVRSLALWQRCLSIGVQATLIIGVRPEPFAAHSWVQLDGLVLNDAVEHVRTFTPIWVMP